MKYNQDKILRDMIAEYKRVEVFIAKMILAGERWEIANDESYECLLDAIKDLNRYGEQVLDRAKFVKENKWTFFS